MRLSLSLWLVLAYGAGVESDAGFGTVPGSVNSDNNSQVELFWEVTGVNITESESMRRTFFVGDQRVLSRNLGISLPDFDDVDYVGNSSFTGLRINMTSKYFAGRYTCHISLAASPPITDTRAFLYVFDYPSSPPNETDSVRQLESTSYSFNCTSESTSYPVENRTQHTLMYRWTFDQPMDSDRYDTSSSDPGQHQDDILTVNQIMKDDDYVITCTVGEDDSSLTSSVYYTLKTWDVPGNVTTRDLIVEVKTGASFDLQLETTDPGYPPSIFFCNMTYKNELLSTTDGEFTFHPVNEEHTETIECYLENDEGRGPSIIITVIVSDRELDTTAYPSTHSTASPTISPTSDSATLTHTTTTTFTTFTTDSVESTPSGQRPSESSWNDLFLIPILVVAVLVLGLLLVVVYRRCCNDDSTEQEYKAGGGRLVQSTRSRDTAVRYALSRNGTAYYTNDAYSGYRI